MLQFPAKPAFESTLATPSARYTLFREAAAAAVSQAMNSPHEWGGGTEGYAERFASNMGFVLVHNTISYGLSSAFHEDNRYFASGKNGKMRRALHAALSPFETRHDDGRVGFSYSNVTGVVGASLISRAWAPPELAGWRKHWQDHRLHFRWPSGIQHIPRIPAGPAASSIGLEYAPAVYWTWRVGRLRVRGKGRAYRLSTISAIYRRIFFPPVTRTPGNNLKGDRHVRRRPTPPSNAAIAAASEPGATPKTSQRSAGALPRRETPRPSLKYERFERRPDPSSFALNDAQRVLARAYGYESWPKLKAFVDGANVHELAEAVQGRRCGQSAKLC